MSKAKAVGINHIALEVGNIEEALEFYSSLFEFELRGRGNTMAFIDLGDQFIALSESEAANDPEKSDDHRHFGFVVDDVEKVRASLQERGVPLLDTSGLDFRDPWGNRWQVVGYRNVQFRKPRPVADAMNLDQDKTEKAEEELKAKGMF